MDTSESGATRRRRLLAVCCLFASAALIGSAEVNSASPPSAPVTSAWQAQRAGLTPEEALQRSAGCLD